MPPGRYDARHIARWSVSVPSCEATICCHRACAHAVSARRTPWSSPSPSCENTHKTHLLASVYLTFRLDESTTTTPLPPPVPRSTRPLRRNSTTLVKHNLLLSINIRHPHRLIGHDNINKTISQLLVDPLTPCLQRSPTKHHLRRASSPRQTCVPNCPTAVPTCVRMNLAPSGSLTFFSSE